MHENGQTGRLRELDETAAHQHSDYSSNNNKTAGGRRRRKSRDWIGLVRFLYLLERKGIKNMKRVSKRRKMFHYDDECRASCCPSIPGLDTDQRIKIELMDLMWRLGGALEEKKRERIRVRRRHRSKRRRTGRGRWLVALTGGRLRRLYRSVSDSASSRVSLCVCVSFRFFFFVFIPLSFSLVDSSYIRVFFLFPSPGTSLPFISLVSDVRVAREGAARRSKSLRGGV